MLFGAAYYPEHWPEDQWIEDAVKMKAAGINTLRMGEFAWCRFEPEEGVFNFEWMDRAIDLFAEHGVKTIMCTCSRTPPPWVFKRYPEILNTDINGKLNNYGARYTVALNHPKFVELSRHIDKAVIEHYASNDNVIGWHIDNEIGAGDDCYCSFCANDFQEYLKEKYETVENLNKSWGESFWSFRFTAFDEVPVPHFKMPNPQINIEYKRFLSDRNVKFAKWRYELMKKLSPEKWITTNFQNIGVSHTDYYELGKYTDVYGLNYYPPRMKSEFILDYYRGDRGKLLVLEQCTRLGFGSPNIGPGWMRLWAYQSIAHGASGLVFFSWRRCGWGQEMFADGLLPSSGKINRRYIELQKMGQEIGECCELIDNTRPIAQAAIVMNYETRWALGENNKNGIGILEDAERFHETFMDMGITIDAMEPAMDLSAYKLVIAPRLFCVSPKVAENLKRYVENGGILCLTALSGIVDEYGKAFAVNAPGPLTDIAGIEIEDYGTLEANIPLNDLSGCLGGVQGEGSVLADEFQPTTADVLANYGSGWRKDTAAITINKYGKGKVIYCGTILKGKTLDAFVNWLCEISEVKSLIETPRGVRAYVRYGQGYKLIFLLNYTEESKTVEMPYECRDIFTKEICTQVSVNAVDVRILKIEVQ